MKWGLFFKEKNAVRDTVEVYKIVGMQKANK